MHDDHHTQRVTDIARQVKLFFRQKKPFHVYHGSTNSTRILSFKRSGMIDVSKLDKVLAVNVGSTALVEPNVPMDTLVAETLKYGLVPPVVMEFPGITVGGGIQGGAGESSSFKYGCFNQICNSYEMVLADGQILHASANENADLFYGTAGSYGTFGVITSAEIQLIPAKKYVQLTYLPVTNFQEAVDVLEQATKQKFDYIDGIMFGANHGVIITGNLSNEVVGRLQRFKRARDPWYYLHAEEIDKRAETITETVPLIDYLFRYDRGAFWVGRYAFEMFDVPFNAFMRWLLNPILHTRKLYQALQESGASQQHLVQDLALPLSTAAAFMEFVDENLGVYPLWLCPLKADTKSPLQSNNLKTPLVINVGVWGNKIESREAFLKANRLLEHKLSELGGKKWFYAHSYYTKDEFWNRYDKKWYDTLRKKYKATTLPDVYEKIRVKDHYVINLKRGLYRTIFRRAKIRIED
jgi:delta24-sterol reductase